MFLCNLLTFYLMFCRNIIRVIPGFFLFLFWYHCRDGFEEKRIGKLYGTSELLTESWKEFSLTWEQRASSWAFTECLAYLGPPHLRSQPS